MRDAIPSILEQGKKVTPLKSSLRSYNSGMMEDSHGLLFCSRSFCPWTQTAELVWQRLAGHRLVPIGSLNLRAKGPVHFEDARLLMHNDRLLVAYTEGRYDRKPFLSAQGLALMAPNGLQPARQFQIHFGGNFRRSEKNWQFFSRGGHLHFVYSIQPHIVARLNGSVQVDDEWTTKAEIHWPGGTLRGGTPPILDGDSYVSFFHASHKHPTRHRRYSMGAYRFDSKPPFSILEITDPILVGSENDTTLPHPYHPAWRPLTVFPAGAVKRGDGYLVCLGVNDSSDALLEIPDAGKLPWHPVGYFSKPRVRAFATNNPKLPVSNGKGIWLNWKRKSPLQGELETDNPDVAENLINRPGVRETEVAFK